jgi:hypothetical protein
MVDFSTLHPTILEYWLHTHGFSNRPCLDILCLQIQRHGFAVPAGSLEDITDLGMLVIGGKVARLAEKKPGTLDIFLVVRDKHSAAAHGSKMA